MIQVIVMCLFWALWRRILGKGDSGISRGLLAMMACGILVPFFYAFCPWNVSNYGRGAFSLVLGVVVYGLYWSKGHGMIMDKGTGGKPTPELLARYEKTIGYRLACWLLPESEWYGYKFDSLMMLARYGLPAAVVAVFMWNPWFLLTGLLPSPIYTLSLVLERKRPQLFKRWSWLESYKDLAEILTGAQFGLIYGLNAVIR